MIISVDYGQKSYRQGSWFGEHTIRIAVEKETWFPRPRDAEFPHGRDRITVTYHFVPKHQPRSAGIWPMGSLTMPIEQAEDLAHLLIHSIQQAKRSRKPVDIEVRKEQDQP